MNSYKTNKKLYIPLLGIAIIITFSALLIPLDSPWFTIAAGIGCGGIASVIVAWLVEAADCREKGVRSKAIYAIPWASFTFFVYSYATLYQVLHKEKLLEKTEKHTWIEWKDILVAELRKNPDEKPPEKLKSVFAFSSRGMREELNFIMEQRAQLMAAGLMSLDVYNDLQSISQKVDLCETELNYGTCRDFAFFLSSLAISLESFFKKDTELARYNNVMYFDLIEFVEGSEKNPGINI